MMNDFISAIIVHSIVLSGNIRLDEVGLGQVSMRHAGDEDSPCSEILFDCIWRFLTHSSLMIDPAVLAELVLNCSPGHSLLKVCQVALWVDKIPQRIQWLW